MKLTKRMQTIANLVNKNEKVIDIGTDHAYVPIYLYLNNITHDITATDISKKVLENAYNSLKKYNLENNIKLILSDGFKDINENYDVAIISGMGAHTIINILNNQILPKKIIIESNNDHYLVRKYLNKINYKLEKEYVILDNKKYYIIMYYIYCNEELTEEELILGKHNNKEYFDYLIEKYSILIKKIQNKEYLKYLKLLKKYRSRL